MTTTASAPGESSADADRRAPLLQAGALDSVDVYITGLCNRRCDYCFLPAEFLDTARHMSTDEYTTILKWMVTHDVPDITLLGGEASLHPSFIKFVDLAADRGLAVRIVTNGHRRFRRAVEAGQLTPDNVSRVAVSLDTSVDELQDRLRGKRASDDAALTIAALNDAGIPFDVNVTGLTSIMNDLDEHVAAMCRLGARRVNIHWPSTIGLGSHLPPDQIPAPPDWTEWVRWVQDYETPRDDFFVEIERGFLDEAKPVDSCAVTDMSNLQIFPGGLTYRCGLLVDQPHMSSLAMRDGHLIPTRETGEAALGTAVRRGCNGCPLASRDGKRACIYDKVASDHRG